LEDAKRVPGTRLPAFRVEAVVISTLARWPIAHTHTCTAPVDTPSTKPSLTALCCPQFGGLDIGAFLGLLFGGLFFLIVSCCTGGVACCCPGEDEAMQAAPPGAAVGTPTIVVHPPIVEK